MLNQLHHNDEVFRQIKWAMETKDLKYGTALSNIRYGKRWEGVTDRAALVSRDYVR